MQKFQKLNVPVKRGLYSRYVRFVFSSTRTRLTWLPETLFVIFLFTIIRDEGHCNHIAGLLYTLNHWFLLGITEIPAQMWHQPRGGRIVAEPIMNCVFANSSADRAGTRNKLPVTCKLYDTNLGTMPKFKVNWPYQDYHGAILLSS